MLFWAVAENQRFLLGSSEKSSISLVTWILMAHKNWVFQKSVPCVNWNNQRST